MVAIKYIDYMFSGCPHCNFKEEIQVDINNLVELKCKECKNSFFIFNGNGQSVFIIGHNNRYKNIPVISPNNFKKV